MPTELKAPFPYFGGKRAVASTVWNLFGEVRNFVEPFCGSAAVLLGRPSPVVGSETLNDYSCALINAWRAIAQKPEELTGYLVGPVAEVETEAQQWSLIQSEFDLRQFLGDPEWCDARFAAYYIRGANEWIGSGWCCPGGPWSWSRIDGWSKRKLPHLGDAGTGINRQLPHLGDAGKGEYELRCDFVYGWMNALRDRLSGVRIACGSWERVLSPSVCEKHGTTAVFLDPPYADTEYVYRKDTESLSNAVSQWALENGGKEHFRIVVAGRGDEHDQLLSRGWRKQVWTANRGYSFATNNGRKMEALWVSPYCVNLSLADLI